MSLGTVIGDTLLSVFGKSSKTATTTVSKNVDVLDPFGTIKSGTAAKTNGIRYTQAEQGTVLKDYAAANPSFNSGTKIYSTGGMPVDNFYVPSITEAAAKAAKESDTINKIAVEPKVTPAKLANEPIKTEPVKTTVVETATKTTSPLKTALKVGAVGVGTTSLGLLAGSVLAADNNMVTPSPENADNGNGGTEPYKVVQGAGNEGTSTVIYQPTDMEGVGEGMNFLQTQIDEIVKFVSELVNSLFGGGTDDGGGAYSGTNPYDFAVYEDGTEGTSAGISPIKIIVFGVIVIGLGVILFKKFGGKKHGGKK